MNILVINGSPKGSKSNTYRLTSAFTEGICDAIKNRGEDVPAVEVIETVRLDIKPCSGCFSCWSKTPGTCRIRDDMSEVIRKLLWADITVWSFPLYYFGLPGPLKTLIDRQLPMSLPFMSCGTQSGGHPSRYDIAGKKNVIISTCGFYTARGNYDSVLSMFDRFCGGQNYTAILCGQGELFRVKELAEHTDRYLSCVTQAGREYITSGITPATRDKLNEDLLPRDVFEAMADASWGVGEAGEKEEESRSFTRQMAALYNKASYPGHDIILDMNYTDIAKTYRIVLGKDGSTLSDDFSAPFTVRIDTPYSVWSAIARGELDGADALMKHLYRVEGDFDVMIHWDDYFGAVKKRRDVNSEVNSEKRSESESVCSRKTNMNILLIPWIVFWVAAAVNGLWGAFISIALSSAVPIVFLKNKTVVYDRLSLLGVVFCSIALLAGIPPLFVLPLSYLLFGLMWTVSCFTSVPLTAHYSMYNFGGKAALHNPIFIQTNRIITAAWGILYLLTPVWTYCIMRTGIASYAGAVNSVLPALMGIFTVRFQKWYPKHVAGGKKGRK